MVTVACSITKEDFEKLSELAKSRNKTISEVVRDAIQLYIKMYYDMEKRCRPGERCIEVAVLD